SRPATIHRRFFSVLRVTDRSTRNSIRVLTRLHSALPSGERNGRMQLLFPTSVLATQEGRRWPCLQAQAPKVPGTPRTHTRFSKDVCRKTISPVASALHSKARLPVGISSQLLATARDRTGCSKTCSWLDAFQVPRS